MKKLIKRAERKKKDVASFAEAWIENLTEFRHTIGNKVASFAEAWIEKKPATFDNPERCSSPPSRRRGLKIPIPYVNPDDFGRLLRGGVD